MTTLRWGFRLEYATLAWNVVGIAVLVVAALGARSVALAGFGLDSLIEIGASVVVMLALAAGKRAVGRALRNPVLLTEARVTVVDGLLAGAVLLGLLLNAGPGWWWADPLAGYVLVGYAVREFVFTIRDL